MLVDSLQQLFSSGLYSNVVELANLANCNKESFLETLEAGKVCQVQVIIGDSLLELKEWKRAELIYRQVLQGKKHLKVQNIRSIKQQVPTLNINDSLSTASTDNTSEVEIRHKLHLCYLGMGQANQARSVLESISAKSRPAKVHMALAKLYHSANMERPAIASYREVVRECPLALEANRGLLQLGVKPREIQELILESESELGADWLLDWLSGLSKLHTRDYEGAVRDLVTVEPSLPASPGLAVDIGLAHHWAGEQELAVRSLSRVASLNPMTMRGMDALAALYAETGRLRELENLSTRLMGICEDQPQPWVAMGYFCHHTKKSPKAVYFAHKACLLDPRNIEALLLKGRVLHDLKKLPDAMNHFREALGFAPHRFEAHKGLVDCYLGLSRQREAVTIATGACKHLSNSPRALTLYASVLLKEPLSCARAKSLLEKAAVTGHLPAVYKLVELLDREGATQRAIDLLQQQLQHTSTATLHQKLADMFLRAGCGAEDKAVEHYSKALALDPKNEAAIQGLQKMEASTDGMEASYDISEMEEKYEVGSVGRASPVVGDIEDSETEAVWSDGDLNLGAATGP